MTALLLVGGFFTSAFAFMASLAMLARENAGAKASTAKKTEALILHAAGEAPKESALRKQLSQAGFPGANAVRNFNYLKSAAAIAGFLLGTVLLRQMPQFQKLAPLAQLGFLMLWAVMGYFVPVMVVDKRRAAYMKRIELALPDALDFMLICVEAGQSSDVAIMRVAEDLAPVHPDLAAHFLWLTEALAAGANRSEAWLRMAQDTENDDIRQLASIIVQSTSMGTPVAQTLRVFAADLRDRRIRKVEERANVLPTKMTLGTMFFTIPPLLILLLAPAIYRISMSF